MKLRTASFAAAVLVAAVSPNLSTTAQARPFGFHGGFGHGGWGHGGWGHGGWGWGGVGVGLATGALIGAAIASPYGYGYGYPGYGYGYGYPVGYGYAPAYVDDYDYAPAYGYGYTPAYGYAAATPYWGGYRRYGYGVGYRATASPGWGTAADTEPATSARDMGERSAMAGTEPGTPEWDTEE
jgi:hypothetical protein